MSVTVIFALRLKMNLETKIILLNLQAVIGDKIACKDKCVGFTHLGLEMLLRSFLGNSSDKLLWI